MTTLALDVIYRDHGADRGMRSLGQQTDRTAGRFKGLKVAGAAALAAVGVAAVKFGADSVRAYVAAESSQIRLQEAFRKFPKLADINIGSLQKLNTQLALKTRFDDDATASGQAVLAQFKLTGTQITQLTPLLQDYAAKTGKDLPTAARDLGKAMLGQGRSLKAVGINFKDTGSAGGNFSQIMGGLRSQVGGFAEREGKSAAGQAEILKNQFGELQEAAGKQLLPALLKIGSGLLNVVTYVQDSNGVFGSFKRIVSATFGAFSESVGLGRISFRRFADFVSTHQADITLAIVAGGKVVLAFAAAFATMAEAGLRGAGLLMDGYANLTELLFSSFRGISRAAVLAFGWIPGVGDRIKEADAKFGAFADTTVSGMRRAAAGARGAADGIDTKLRPALDKAGKALDSVGRKEIVKAAARDAVNRASIAIRNLGTASDGSQIRLKKFADISRLSANEQRAFRQRLADTRQRMLEQRDAGIKAGDSQKELTRRWNLGRQALEREFRQMGLSKEEARKLAIRYSQIPKKVQTNVTTPGAQAARTGFRDLDRRINDLNDKGVSITFETNAKKFGLTATELNAARRSRARGGILPGFTPVSQGDDQVVNMRSGEGVYVSEAMRNPYERQRLHTVNKAALAGQPLHQFQGLAAGGLVRRNVSAKVGDPGISGVASRANAMANAVALGMSYRVAQSVERRIAALGAGGGPIGGAGYANALRWARSQVGKPYIWTGVGPGGYDCSGFMSALVNVIRGKNPYHRLFSTGMAGGQHLAGMTRGKMSPFRIGVWKNNPGHTAGTLNGVNVESSGGVGVRVGGRARGANNGLFNLHYGLARGGMVGDPPYDTTHRGGQRYDPETERLWKMFLGERGLHRGGVVRRPGVRMLSERGPERVLSARQTNAFERMVGAMDRGRGGGNTYNVTVNAPNYVGANQDLVNTMVQMGKRGQMDVVLRSAGVRV